MNATAGRDSDRRSREKEDESKNFANVQNFDFENNEGEIKQFLKPKRWKNGLRFERHFNIVSSFDVCVDWTLKVANLIANSHPCFFRC